MEIEVCYGGRGDVQSTFSTALKGIVHFLVQFLGCFSSKM